jgi:[protein-PII] uridylyltransferase
MDLVAADRPGLLSKVGQTFIELGIDIEAAKIMTIGERAEDVFYISDEAGRPLDSEAKQQLRDNLVAKLDD